MGWGLFRKKVDNGCWVCKKSGPFLNAGCIVYYISSFCFTFYLLGGVVHTHTTHPHPAYTPGHIKTTKSPPLFKHTRKTDLLQNLH